MDLKKFIIYTLIAVVFFILGIVGDKVMFSNSIAICPTALNSDNTYEAGWLAAKQRLIATGVIRGGNQPVNIINGSIKSAEGPKIVMELNYPLEILADPDLDERIVEIDSSSEIIKEMRKNEAEYQQELTEYNTMLRENPEIINTSDLPPMPSICESKPVDIEELEVGQSIEVESAQDIKSIKQFTADKVTVRCQ